MKQGEERYSSFNSEPDNQEVVETYQRPPIAEPAALKSSLPGTL